MTRTHKCSSLYVSDTWLGVFDVAKSDDQPVRFAFNGPTTVTVQTPLYKTPIFLKVGSDQGILDLEALYQESLEIARDRPTLPDGSQLDVQ